MLCSSIVLPVRGRRDDEAALSLADRRHQVHDAAGEQLRRRFEHEPFLRIERRQVLEEQLLAGLVRSLEVDRLDLDEGKVPLALFRRTDLARHGVAGLQIELPDLRRRDVDVVGPRQVVVVGRAQEPEPVGQHLEHAFREDEAALLGLRLEDLEDQLLLAHARRAGDGHVLGDLGELLDAHVLQIGDVEPARLRGLRRLGRASGAGAGSRCLGGGAGVGSGARRT